MLQDLLVELQLVDRIDQIIFLVADVDAVKSGQEVAFNDSVTGTELPKNRLSFSRSTGVIGDVTFAMATRPKLAGSSIRAIIAINASWKQVTVMVENAPQLTPKASFFIFDILRF